MGSIRVIVAGYGPIYRAGLVSVLPSSDATGHVAVVAEAGGLARTVRLVRLLHPDLVITDLNFPEDDPHVVQHLTAAYPATRVLLLAEGCDGSKLQNAWSQGVSGYLTGPMSKEEVLRAIRMVASGERFVETGFGPKLGGPVSGGTSDLSEREREVLRLLAAGYTNAEVARRLVISPRTAETHRSNIQRKLGLRTRAELARAVFSNRRAGTPPLPESTSA